MNESKRHLAKMFYAKFEAIPDEKWCTGITRNRFGQRCALGHLGITSRVYDEKAVSEAKSLACLISNNESLMNISAINDGQNKHFKQPTPKGRILAALEHIIRQ